MLKKLLFIFAAVTASSYVQAAVVYPGLRCDGCTQIQMRSKAQTYVVNGYIYVANLQNNVLRYYSNTVEKVLIDTGGVYRYFAVSTELPIPDPDLVNFVSTASYFYSATSGTMHYKAVIGLPPPSTAASGISASTAYDAINDSPARTSVERWAANTGNWPTSSQALFLLKAALQTGKILGGSKIYIQFEGDFPDGSRIDLAYDSETQSCKYVPGSAYDSHGNHIPDVVGDVAGRTFDFSGSGNSNDSTRMVNRLKSFGVTFGGVAVGGTILACTHDEYSGTNCQWVPRLP